MWIPNLPSIDWKAAWNLTADVVSKPEVKKAALIGTGAVVAVGGITVGLPALGFTAAGIKGASYAALWQSSIGNVVAGSAFAKLTSTGAAGMALSTKGLLGIGGGYLSSKLFSPKEEISNLQETVVWSTDFLG